MRVRSLSLLGLIALILAGVLPGIAMATSRDFDTDGYRSPQFGYIVTWSDDWAARERDASSIAGEQDTLVLATNAGRLQVIGQQTDTPANDLMMETIEQLTATASVVQMAANDSTPDLPSYIVRADSTTYQIDIHDLDGVLVTAILSARETRFDQAQELAQTVILNGTPLFTGETAATTEDIPDPATPDDTEGIGIDGTTFTSSYGFSLEWDDEWTATEFLEAEYEFLNLTGETGSIIVVGTNLYAGDAEACLEGEDAYYATQDPDIRDWDIALDRRGNEIYQASETFASGIFTYTYATGGDLDLVDYIECRTLEPGETTMIVLMTATQDLFLDHLDVALPITNAIQMPAGAELDEESQPRSPVFSTAPEDEATVEATEEPDATEEATTEADQPETTGESGLDGTTFTSPGFGFSLDIPDGWQVQSEEIAAGDEFLLLFNGTSLITVRASDTLPLDPAACVNAVKAEAVENPLYADLALDFTANGDPFQGADDLGAYALFTYTGDDGGEWSYFVRCEPLVEDESVLVIVQDVPSDDYIAERQARRLIQISIDRP